MADKRISQLTEATSMTSTDIFVIEQDSQTKKVTEQTFINALATALSGKGGISSIAKTSTSGLVDTYTITYANQTTSTFTVTNGAKGDTGLNSYVYVRYSTNQPTQDSDMHTWADRWLGTATGSSSTAPTTYTSYKWYDTKGVKGDTGTAGVSPTLSSSSILYAESDSGETIPTTGWQSTVPTVTEGSFLWTKITIEFSTGDPIVAYSVGKIGTSGTGSGTVSRVAVSCTDSSLTVSGSPVTTTGTISVAHANTTLTPQTTSGVYPIKIDAKGHITQYGSAATASTFNAISKPESASQGQVLTYDGTTWVAQNATGAVSSVNGYTGTIVLDNEDVGAVAEPSSEGSNGMVLTTNGSGGRTWASVGGISLVSLWTNSDDTADFSAQTVTIAGTNYSMFLVINKSRKSVSTYHNDIIIKGQAAELINKDTGANTYGRSVTISDTTATFGAGYAGNATDPKYCVPAKIYGISGITL